MTAPVRVRKPKPGDGVQRNYRIECALHGVEFIQCPKRKHYTRYCPMCQTGCQPSSGWCGEFIWSPKKRPIKMSRTRAARWQ